MAEPNLFCEECGKSINPVAKFCTHCGHPVKPTKPEKKRAVAATTAVQTPVSVPAENSPVTDNNFEELSAKSNISVADLDNLIHNLTQQAQADNKTYLTSLIKLLNSPHKYLLQEVFGRLRQVLPDNDYEKMCLSYLEDEDADKPRLDYFLAASPALTVGLAKRIQLIIEQTTDERFRVWREARLGQLTSGLRKTEQKIGAPV